ncbi:MAG: hypothetical protein V1850_06130, partial [Candidatus Bathyarchaeota archaeon]
TACDTAGINELYINAFMGHVNGMGQSYSEISIAKLELEFMRVEPYLTVYGESEEISRLKTDLEKDRENQQRIINGMLAENIELKNALKNLEKESNAKYSHLEDAFNKTVDKLVGDLKEAKSDIGFLKQRIFYLEEPDEEHDSKKNLQLDSQ